VVKQAALEQRRPTQGWLVGLRAAPAHTVVGAARYHSLIDLRPGHRRSSPFLTAKLVSSHIFHTANKVYRDRYGQFINGFGRIPDSRST
jgi:hypothetical protein